MARRNNIFIAPPTTSGALAKTPTGIAGLDEILDGGIPRGRPTLVCGGAGCGKTMLAAEILCRGATLYNEPGVFMMFEENASELATNLHSIGFDVNALVKAKKVALDFVYIERREIEETGEYDLEGLFIRLRHAIDTVKAKRVVLDTLEALFSGFADEAILRAELRRLFRWLKDAGITAIITGERGESSLTRYGIEEYVADCVILLDHRVVEQISTRRLRVVKYRGSRHGTNEYPFMIGDKGFSVLPITSLRLDHKASRKRVATGIAKLDDMLGAKGVYRGSSVLVSGSPGTGKSSVAMAFVDEACRRGERCLVFVYEESVSQLTRNMRSIGINLQQWIDDGRLVIHASRPTLYGLEQHLMHMHQMVLDGKPDVVVVDPMSNLTLDASDEALKPTLMRLIDFLKDQGITVLFTLLTADTPASVSLTQTGISSLMDTWLLLSNMAENRERIRTIQVAKSRGMDHSNQIREFVITSKGIDLIDIFMTPSGPLAGHMRRNEQASQAGAAKTARLALPKSGSAAGGRA